MNKITLMLAGLCICGSAMAQGTSVDGSNTAVVIRKAPVYSKDSNYQLLVVPVKALDITASATDTAVPLADMLPPASYQGYKVTPLNAGGTSGSVTYTATQTTGDTSEETTYAWTPSDSTSPAELAPGTIFWLQKPASTATGTTLSTGGFGGFTSLATTTESTAASTNDAPIVFCGEANEVTLSWASTQGVVVPMGNSNSAPIKLGDITSAPLGAQIFRITSDSSDYDQYYYTKETKVGDPCWRRRVVTSDATTWEDATEETIPAAEAFYYYAN